jgi:hypothetical protein
MMDPEQSMFVAETLGIETGEGADHKIDFRAKTAFENISEYVETCSRNAPAPFPGLPVREKTDRKSLRNIRQVTPGRAPVPFSRFLQV